MEQVDCLAPDANVAFVVDRHNDRVTGVRRGGQVVVDLAPALMGQPQGAAVHAVPLVPLLHHPSDELWECL
jgi:hypothetical protein